MSAPIVSEEQLLEAMRRIPSERWGEVLTFVQVLHQQTNPVSAKHWTAAELLKLPLAQRDAILAGQAALAAADYASDPALTDFNAFGEHDLYVDSSDTQSR